MRPVSDGVSQLKTVMITGVSTGIGKACAVLLAREGFRVYGSVRKPEDGEALCREIGERFSYLLMDVTREGEVRQAAESLRIDLSGQGLWGLVNNAGVATGGPLEFVPVDEVRRQFEVNVVGQVAVTQAFMPLMREARGRIVNIGSVGGLVSTPFQAPYNASKFALEALTDSLRVELRPWGMQVAIVEPGNIATPIWEKSLSLYQDLSSRLPPETLEYYGPVLEKLRKHLAKPRDVPPDVVAEAVLHALTAERPKTRYLIGDDARSLARLRYLPDRLRDWFIARRVPKYGPDA